MPYILQFCESLAEEAFKTNINGIVNSIEDIISLTSSIKFNSTSQVVNDINSLALYSFELNKINIFIAPFDVLFDKPTHVYTLLYGYTEPFNHIKTQHLNFDKLYYMLIPVDKNKYSTLEWKRIKPISTNRHIGILNTDHNWNEEFISILRL